ncbi:glycosyl hydrolase [Clostridium polyendosporum]|uniref:Sucrose-6-phosphate hydrolase n=1 Tax=Clostridium polyendosporum TaxID=69208 RepID=A0A919S1H8_9CLOT|nr:glycoside hydrolase family 32 protein [Clostridium polyendosporum]GIM30387.1 glycosyl hydrolase [Clostridium polyendosporum]
MNKLNIANDYIKNNSNFVNEQYRLKYHFIPPIGWINDPNGFSYYKGEYHLFYQYYPYDSCWGPMHWGHAVSSDLVKWEHKAVALAPDEEYDADGCFSGSAIEKDGVLYLMYTGHVNTNKEKPENVRQTQCIAYSEDGITFNKIKENPVLTERNLPENALPQDFRDPKVFKKDEYYYTVVGSRNKDDSGQILLYKSEDLIEWKYVGIMIASENKLGKMWECPDLFELNGKYVLIVSPQFCEKEEDRYWNIHSSLYFVGNVDFNTGKFSCEHVDQIDYGHDFYAPQTLIDDKNRRIAITWMQMWERNIPTHDKKHNWAGAMTIPRELELKGDALYQKPISELETYKTNKVSFNNLTVDGSLRINELSGECINLEVILDCKNSERFGIKFVYSAHEYTSIYYDCENEKLILDRSNSGEKIEGSEKDVEVGVRRVLVKCNDNKLKLNILIDRCSIEVFINDGAKTMTSTIYPNNPSADIEFFSNGEVEIVELKKWDICL